MKANAFLIATAALALTACGTGGGNEAAGNNTAVAAENETAGANEATPAPATENASTPAAATAGAAPTRDYVVGKWGEDGDCTLAIEFRADGSTDGPFGNWNLEGNRLTMADNPQAMTVTVIDQNAMSSVGADGRTRRLTRC
jgi:hypothetical protein